MSLQDKLATSHLEDLEGLLAQRVTLFDDPEVPWPRVAEFEERIDAHLAGVLLQGKSVLPFLHDMLYSRDEDLVRAAAFVLAHHTDIDELDSLWSLLPSINDLSQQAVCYALRFADNPSLTARLQQLLADQSPEVRTVAVNVLGYRRELTPDLLAPLLLDDLSDVAREAGIAARRLHNTSLLAPLEAALRNAEWDTASEVAFALLQLNDPSGRSWFADAAGQPDCPGNALFYAATVGCLTQHSFASEGGIRGAAFWGSTDTSDGVIDQLLGVLEVAEPALADAAAQSLFITFGNGPLEKRIITDDWLDPDGELVEREEHEESLPSTSVDDWKSWLAKHHPSTTVSQRLRSGRPITAASLLNDVLDEKSVARRRLVAYWELQREHKLQEHFEPDWPVKRQWITLNNWRASIVV